MLKLPTNAELDAIDMSHIAAHFNDGPEIGLLSAPSGVEHYRLLVWLSMLSGHMNIYEIGTFRGYSAACLAANASNQVVSYDSNLTPFEIKKHLPNLSVRLAEHDEYFDSEIVNGQIIFVDAWHEGKVEKQIYDYLIKKGWNGLLIFDDIDHDNFPGMRAFWNSIEQPGKVNITHIGHHSGTGLIDFSVK